MTSSEGGGGSRVSTETGRFTVRRLRSAFSIWRSSMQTSDMLITGVLVALSLGLGAYVHERARVAARLAFADRAQRLQAAIAEKLKLPSDDLETLTSFLEASGNLTRKQFGLFADPLLLRHKFVYALEWLPFVRDSERLFYEAEARAAGLTTYRIQEPGSDGKQREVGRRPFYVPIHFMEPPSELAIGFDIASDPTRWGIAERARDSGRIVPSGPIRLIEDVGKSDTSPAIALYKAVYREGDPVTEAARRISLAGFAVAIYRVVPLVNASAASVEAAAAAQDPSGLAFVLRDLGAKGAPLLAERPARAARLPRRQGFDTAFPVPCEECHWSLEVFALPGAFLPARRGALEVALAGVLASLLGLAAVTSIRTISRLRRQVEKVGPYRLIARLGHGAMGVVWEARHALLRRPTAVKLLAPGTEGERSLARFEREVQLTAALTHPSTIAIYDYGRTANGVFYYAMELLRGINLLQLVTLDGPLPAARVVHFLRQACGALAEAHAAGLIHRDIKPANLMVCVYGGIPDFLKVLDFGLVKDIGAVDHTPDGVASAGHADVALSQDGSLLGTPLYMAPEGMSDPSKVDERADLFALGAVGYFLLTGNSPFPGHTAIEVFTMERQGPPPPISPVAPHPVPAALEDVLRRCLAFRREERPSSAEALDAMLEACAVSPPWRVADARAWWRDRGPAVLAAARTPREEGGEILNLAADSRARS